MAAVIFLVVVYTFGYAFYSVKENRLGIYLKYKKGKIFKMLGRIARCELFAKHKLTLPVNLKRDLSHKKKKVSIFCCYEYRFPIKLFGLLAA